MKRLSTIAHFSLQRPDWQNEEAEDLRATGEPVGIAIFLLGIICYSPC